MLKKLTLGIFSSINNVTREFLSASLKNSDYCCAILNLNPQSGR